MPPKQTLAEARKARMREYSKTYYAKKRKERQDLSDTSNPKKLKASLSLTKPRVCFRQFIYFPKLLNMILKLIIIILCANILGKYYF